jgi:hypothetical protein
MFEHLSSGAVEANSVRLIWAAFSGGNAAAANWLQERHASSLKALNGRRLLSVACHGDNLAGALALLELASPALRRLRATTRVGKATLLGEIVEARHWIDGASGYGQTALMAPPRQEVEEALRGRDGAAVRAMGGAIPIGPRAAAAFSPRGLELTSVVGRSLRVSYLPVGG